MVQEYNILDCATGFAITRLTAGSWGEILEKSYASQKILRPGVRFFQMRKIFSKNRPYGSETSRVVSNHVVLPRKLAFWTIQAKLVPARVLLADWKRISEKSYVFKKILRSA